MSLIAKTSSDSPSELPQNKFILRQGTSATKGTDIKRVMIKLLLRADTISLDRSDFFFHFAFKTYLVLQNAYNTHAALLQDVILQQHPATCVDSLLKTLSFSILNLLKHPSSINYPAADRWTKLTFRLESSKWQKCLSSGTRHKG